MNTHIYPFASISNALLKAQLEISRNNNSPVEQVGFQGDTTPFAPVEFGPFGIQSFFPARAGTEAPKSVEELIGGTEMKPIDVVLMQLCMDIGQVPSAGPAGLSGYTRSGILTTDDPVPEDAWMDDNGIVHGPDGETWVVLTQEDGWWTDGNGVVCGPDGAWVDENGVIQGPEGFQAAIYVNEYGDVVVAFAGTDPTDLDGDVQTDTDHARGQVTEQHEFAMNLGISLEERYPGRVAFTGHSLGGGLAAAASLATGAPAVTFNAAGLNDATRQRATEKRNDLEESTNGEVDYQEKTTEKYVQEANDGNVRNYYVEGEIVSVINGLPVTPDALGYPIGIKDSDDSLVEAINGNPVWQVVSKLDKRAGLLAIALRITEMVGDHMMGAVAEAILAEGGVVTAIDGNTATMAWQDQASGDVMFTAVTFEDTPEGQRAQREYEMTGMLPDDMSGVESMSASRLELDEDFGKTRYCYMQATFANTPEGRAAFDEFSNGGTLPDDMSAVESVAITEPAPRNPEMSMTTTTQYGENGLPISGATEVYDDGATVMSVAHAYDANGNEIIDQRTYTYAVTPQDVDDVALLEHIFPDDGPFEIGKTYTATLSESDMQELRTSEIGRFRSDLITDDIAGEDGAQGNLTFALNLGTYLEGTFGNLFSVIDFHDKTSEDSIDPQIDEVPDDAGP